MATAKAKCLRGIREQKNISDATSVLTPRVANVPVPAKTRTAMAINTHKYASISAPPKLYCDGWQVRASRTIRRGLALRAGWPMHADGHLFSLNYAASVLVPAASPCTGPLR